MSSSLRKAGTMVRSKVSSPRRMVKARGSSWGRGDVAVHLDDHVAGYESRFNGRGAVDEVLDLIFIGGDMPQAQEDDPVQQPG